MLACVYVEYIDVPPERLRVDFALIYAVRYRLIQDDKRSTHSTILPDTPPHDAEHVSLHHSSRPTTHSGVDV